MRKIFSFFVVFALALSLIAPTASAANGNGYYLYRDVSNNHWAYNYIVYATQYGLVTGFTDGTFVPDGTLTEAQCCQIVYNCLDYGNYGNGYGYNGYNNGYNGYNNGYNNYNGYWYSEAVNFVERNSNLRISPNQSATRSFVCVLIYSFSNVNTRYYSDNGSYYGYNYNNGYNPGYNYYYTNFTDIYSLPSSTQQAIQWCQANGIVNGFQDGSFRPYDSLTRAQGAKVFTITYQMFWQYNYNGGSYYYGDPAYNILNYAYELGITATVEDSSSRNEYRQTLYVYGRNNQKYTYTYRGNQWYDSSNRTIADSVIYNQISNLANSMTQREKCVVACNVAADYAKSKGWRVTSNGEWPSYDKNSGVYWHRLQISNNRKNFTFLVGGNTWNKEAFWYQENNGFIAIDGYREVQNLISSWS